MKVVASCVDIVLFFDANIDPKMIPVCIIIFSVIKSFKFGICYLSLLLYLLHKLLSKDVIGNLIFMIFAV